MFKPAVFALLLSSTLWAQVTVQFSSDPTDVSTGAFAVGPFPSNAFTVSDPSQSTGLRVNLPPSEDSCTSESSPVCSNNSSLNQLTGFSINPRLMVCFSGAVDTSTLASGIGIVALPGRVSTPINQVIFDPNSNCAFAKPNNVLNQGSQYLLLISSAIHDLSGKPVAASPSFASCRTGSSGGYCASLAAALAGQTAPGGRTLVAGSLFTTMQATAWLESARRYDDTLWPALVPAGITSTFEISSLRQFTWVPAGAGLPPQNIPLSAISNVDAVSFGLYLSPNYLNEATITGGPTSPSGFNTVSYHVFTPALKNSHTKIPVVIYGHGLGDSQFGAPTYIASTLAARGFATLAIELPGHGYGPGSYVSLTGTNNKISTVFTPGRGTPLSPGAVIGPTDGCVGPGPIGIRDCGRQAAIDFETLVHDLVATDGLGLNLDPSHIYYLGQSLGSIAGTLFNAVDPTVQVAVLSVGGGTSVDIGRLAINGRPLGLSFLASLNDPALLNVLSLGAPQEEYFHPPLTYQFNDNYVFKDEPPITNTVPGAMAIQAAFEAADWLGMLGDPLAFGPHLMEAPLPGVPAKRVLFQFGYGDLEVPNPTESNLVQAAGGQSDTSFLHFDKAAAMEPILLSIEDPAFPGLPILPHRTLSNPTIFNPGNEAELSLALAEQQQTADFFASNGMSITDPNKYVTAPFSPGDQLFETPINSLPEALNFLQIPK